MVVKVSSLTLVVPFAAPKQVVEVVYRFKEGETEEGKLYTCFIHWYIVYIQENTGENAIDIQLVYRSKMGSSPWILKRPKLDSKAVGRKAQISFTSRFDCSLFLLACV